MAKRWRITAYDGERVVGDWKLVGRVGHREVEQLLARLQARHMSDAEIIAATTGNVDRLLPVKTGRGADFSTSGHSRHYTADEEEA